MLKSRCRFLIPVRDNDGKEFPPGTFARILLMLDQAFSGYRIVDPQVGCWHGQVEHTHEVEISINPRRIPELKKMVRDIGRELGQKAMYFDAPTPSVEIFDVETGESEDDEMDSDSDPDESGEPEDDL
jgi:hypothetical protein